MSEKPRLSKMGPFSPMCTPNRTGASFTGVFHAKSISRILHHITLEWFKIEIETQLEEMLGTMSVLP
jgi:hypothetical protein